MTDLRKRGFILVLFPRNKRSKKKYWDENSGPNGSWSESPDSATPYGFREAQRRCARFGSCGGGTPGIEEET